jgi:hypothetical protein
VLAYVFWHRPRAGVAPEDYEAACASFHRSLAGRPPGGFAGSTCLWAPALGWLGAGGSGYEDWYLVEDYADLGVLNEAAVARGHLTPHDAAARQMGEGTGSVYRLIDGLPRIAGVDHAIWITPARGRFEAAFEDLLVDGVEPGEATLWQRQLALGPAPELCVLASQLPDGTRATRLPAGWTAQVAQRRVVV